MPRLLFAALSGLILAFGQDVSLRPRFVAGDEFTIAMTRTIEERLGTERMQSISRTIRVKVVSTNADGTVLQWRPGPGDLKGTPQGSDARMALATLATADHDFLLALDGNGQYRRTTNVADLAASLDRAREATRARVPAADDPSLATLPKLTALHVASTVSEDAEVFTGFYGMVAAVGQELQMPAAFPMPGGGVPGVRHLRIVSATEEKAEASMTFVLDQAALRRAIPGLDPASPLKIDVTEVARYVFDRKVGLNRSGTMERIAISGPDRRVDRWEFSLTSPPRR